MNNIRYRKYLKYKIPLFGIILSPFSRYAILISSPQLQYLLIVAQFLSAVLTVKAREKSKTGKIICYHNCKIEKNLPNPNLGGAFSFHYFQMRYSLCFSPYIILPYAQYCIVSMLSKSLSVFQKCACPYFWEYVYRMLNVVKNQRRGRIQLKYGTFSADIELPKKKEKWLKTKQQS